MIYISNRRKFLSTAIKSQLMFATVSTQIVQAINSPPPALKEHHKTTLTRIFYLLYPYPELGQAPYQRAVAAMASRLEMQTSKLQFIAEGIKKIDELGNDPWLTLREDEQIAILKKIEHSDFFITVQAFATTQIFNDPQVWQLIGYEGSSLEKGGYLNRGFNDIDWL